MRLRHLRSSNPIKAGDAINPNNKLAEPLMHCLYWRCGWAGRTSECKRTAAGVLICKWCRRKVEKVPPKPPAATGPGMQ